MDHPSPQTSKSTVLEQSKSEGSSSSEPAPYEPNSGTPSVSQDSDESGDPLHDEHADSDDEAWVMENLLRGLPLPHEKPNLSSSERDEEISYNEIHDVNGSMKIGGNFAAGGRASTNVSQEERISCPCCFTTVSLQAQSHDRFEGQFRALFVSNCIVLRTSRVTSRYFPERSDCGELPKKEDCKMDESGGELVDIACAQCGTLVGVLDETETYHFCNVIY